MGSVRSKNLERGAEVPSMGVSPDPRACRLRSRSHISARGAPAPSPESPWSVGLLCLQPRPQSQPGAVGRSGGPGAIVGGPGGESGLSCLSLGREGPPEGTDAHLVRICSRQGSSGDRLLQVEDRARQLALRLGVCIFRRVLPRVPQLLYNHFLPPSLSSLVAP